MSDEKMATLTGILLAAFGGYGLAWYLGLAEGNFALLLFLVTVVTGIYWVAEKRIFLPRRRAQSAEPVSFGRLGDDVDRLAVALLDLGLRRGDRVGLIAENRYEWLLVDLALASVGAVDVPRGSDTTPTEVGLYMAGKAA